MVKAKGYFDKKLNPEGKGGKNDFEVRDVEGGTVIYDAVTILTWQGGNKFKRLSWKNAKEYVDTLSYAGGGWRLPTFEEAMSLMKPEKVEHSTTSRFDSLYIDTRFKGALRIWTSDLYRASDAWIVAFFNGTCNFWPINRKNYVRAVR